MIYIKKIQTIQSFQINLALRSEKISKSNIYCTEGSVVEPNDIIAKTYKSEHAWVVDLYSELGLAETVSEADLDKYLLIKDGQMVQKGKIIAKKQSILSSYEIKSPFEGIVNISKASHPQLTIRTLPIETDIKAFVRGKVIAISDANIKIETNVFKIVPSIIMGGNIFGKLQVIKSLEQLGYESKNSIIFFNGMVDRILLAKAQIYGVTGIVGKTIDYSLLPSKNNTQITVASLEGFGESVLDTYDKIIDSDGYLIHIDIHNNELIIGTNNLNGDANALYEQSCYVNDMVQVFTKQHYGHIGKVKRITNNNLEIMLKDNSVIKVKKSNVIGILT